jgi:predicted amidohydrolase YtcJ
MNRPLPSRALLAACLAGLALGFAFGQTAGPAGPADLVILHAAVHTVNAAAPQAQAVAVVGDRIAAVGTDAEIGRWTGPKTRVIDGTGLAVYPGFIEAHAHLMGVAQAAAAFDPGNWWNRFLDWIGAGSGPPPYLDLSAAAGYDEVVALVARAAARAKPGQWIVGGAWHQSKWTTAPVPAVAGFPVHDDLSRVSPRNPVFLAHASGHAALVNAQAMALAGLGPDHPGVEGGELVRDPAGKLTGVLVENAQILVSTLIPPPDAKTQTALLKTAQDQALANGITGFHDMGVDRAALDLYQRAAAAGELRVRLYCFLIPGQDGRDFALFDEWFKRGPLVGAGGGFLTVRGIKLFADGALGSKSAWLLSPYDNAPGKVGEIVMPMDLIGRYSRAALAAGFQVGTHAIGDRANREVLDQYQAAFEANPAAAADSRFRIEHAQHVDPADQGRFAALGVVAVMQTIHFSSDIPWAIDRLGPERIAEDAYVWRNLLASGARIANGTDSPVEPLNPIANFYAAVARRTLAGKRFDWSHPEQAMTREEALRSMTYEGAYAAFEEGDKGSLEAGKLADLTVLSQDLMTVPEDQILKTKVRFTIVGGRVAYQK